MSEVKAYAAPAADAALKPHDITRREVGETDIEIDILYCGVCHSDIHTARNEWGGSVFPVVPGHEIVGRITAVGNKVDGFKVGDIAGVGCMVDSCRECEQCKAGDEQFCEKGMVGTYNSPDKHTGKQTYGGYSTKIVVEKDFVLHIPENLDLKGVAPLLCAGITTYSPLSRYNVGPGMKVAVVGLGGLGHMGVKIAAAMGADVTMISTSESKKADAEKLGAKHFINSKDPEQMNAAKGSFNFILNTVSAPHDYNILLELLKVNGTMVLVGAPPEPAAIMGFNLIFGRRMVAGSLIGGIAETQEMLDFCGKHNITSDIEMIDMKDINEAYERIIKSDVKYRFVIDMASLKN